MAGLAAGAAGWARIATALPKNRHRDRTSRVPNRVTCIAGPPAWADTMGAHTRRQAWRARSEFGVDNVGTDLLVCPGAGQTRRSVPTRGNVAADLLVCREIKDR